MKWISVEDNLPKNDELVWVYCPKEGFDTQKQRCVRTFLNDNIWTKKIITHWRPLSEPPTNTN